MARGLLTSAADGVPVMPRELGAGDGRTGAAGAGDPRGEAPRDRDMKPGPRAARSGPCPLLLTHGDTRLLCRPPRGHRLPEAESPSSKGTCPTLKPPKGPTGKGGCGPWVPGSLDVNVQGVCSQGLVLGIAMPPGGRDFGGPRVSCTKPGISGRWVRSPGPGGWRARDLGTSQEPDNLAMAWLSPMSPGQASVSPFACQMQAQTS